MEPVLPTTASAGETKPKEDKVEKSYLSGALESMSAWGAPSRTSTPKPVAPVTAPGEGSGLTNQHGGDRHTQHYGLSSKRYPSDCPPLNARWFYAVDVPKRKPKILNTGTTTEEEKPGPPPKKFVVFSMHDSRAIETTFQTLADEFDDPQKETNSPVDGTGEARGTVGDNRTSVPEDGTKEPNTSKFKVPVHEDFLFEVDIEKRELSPVYWLGPTYEIRRGSWFYSEGSTLRACEENLSTQLEDGYLRVKPFRYPKTIKASRPVSLKPGEAPQSSMALSGAFGGNKSGSREVTPRASLENLRAAGNQTPENSFAKENPVSGPQTHRLFGAYMNSVVTYQDSTVAWLSADSYISKLSSTMYQKFSGGGYLSGIKLVRGFADPKTKDTESKIPTTPLSAAMRPPDTPTTLQLDEKQQKLLKRKSSPPSIAHTEPEAHEPANVEQPLLTEESEREADEREIRNDYHDRDNENQARDIEHLVLVTHGIGQRLGMRTESVNFIHDVNVLRQTLKNVYENSPDLQAFNSEMDKLPKNCRVQVLPICWRHLLDFPKKGVRQSRKEQDLGDAFGDEEEYPSLQDITPDGVPFVRSLISDLALDILLYQSGYRDHISRIVLAESNRIYNLFRERNPNFKGKVSLVGHSLGSAIFFDILCRQKEEIKKRTPGAHRRQHEPRSTASDFEFLFDVEDFYCLGSPIGLFQMLKGRNICGRTSHVDARPAESPLDPDSLDDPFLASGSNAFSQGGDIPHTLSSPKLKQLFNVFYPSDPISYRLEPLISPAMSSMKPQVLPYTKRTLGGSVSGIGAKVGQSVSGLWSSLSSGIASSLLNRSLGLTNEDVARMEAPSSSKTTAQSVAAGTNITGGGVIPSEMPALLREKTNEKKQQLAESTAAADREGTGSNVPTLIDDEMETLYAGFEKRRKAQKDQDTDEDWVETQKSMRREDAKVRALNYNGRVDYSVQESVLDFNPMNTIASHLSYWADEDVNHFVLSQLLSRHRKPGHPEK